MMTHSYVKFPNLIRQSVVDNEEQEKRCTYNVILKRVRTTTVVVEQL